MNAAAMTNNAIADQLSLLEAPVTAVLVKGSVKNGMKEVSTKVNEKGEKIASSRDLWQCDPHELRVIPGLNPRVETESYLAHIRSIADSMKSEGFYQDKPLAGYVAREDGKDVVYIYEGGSRLRSSLLAISEDADFKTVPVSVNQEALSMEDILVAMVRSNDGRPLSMYEKSIIVKRLVRHNVALDEISLRLGIKKPVIANMILLMEAPFEIRELVANETVAFTFAVEMIVQHEEKALAKIRETQAAASAAGKTQITKRFVPGAKFKKAVSKAAPVMFSALSELQADPGFAGLSEETREKLAGLLKGLEAARVETAAGEGAEDGENQPAE